MNQTQTMPKRPTSVEEVGKVVRAAREGGMRVRVVGSGSMARPMEGPVQEVSMLRMNKVLEHAVGDMTVVVQAGISLEGLQKELAWRDQWLPVDPVAVGGRGPGQRTIGGLIATNSLGPLRMGCGDWRLLIMGMRWVSAEGVVVKGGGRTVKNVAGYNTPRLMIGSEGGLGVIGEVTLRTFARPRDEQGVVFFCESAERAEGLVGAVLLSETTPAYVEVVGGRTFAGNNLGLPSMGKGMVVVVGFLDRAKSCAQQVEMVRGLEAARGMESISQTAAQAGRLRLWMTSEPVAESGGVGFRLSVMSSQVADVVEALEKRGAWVVSEAASGVVRGVMRDGGKLREVAEKFGAGVMVTQGELGGSARDALALRIKKAVDPEGIFGAW